MYLTIISGILFAFLCVFFINLLCNLLIFDRLRFATKEGVQRKLGTCPMVSILVPARNEENHIEECVRSLIGQKYEHLEVLVLDDHSTDETPGIVQRIIDELPLAQQGRLHLLRSEPLPGGWVGKNFACSQLTQHAQGDYLIFTDADAIHAPQMVSSVLHGMHNLGVHFLTVHPSYMLRGMGERLAIPLLYLKVFTLLPLLLVRHSQQPILAVANGVLLCFQRSVYEEIGGHRAVKTSLLEDNALARKVKAAGYRMAYVDGQDLVSCYMYDSFAEVWIGFSRTFFAFYNYSLLAAMGMIILDLALFVVPPLLALVSLAVPFAPSTVSYLLGSYMLAVWMRMLLALACARSQRLTLMLLSLLHPLSILLECLFILNSIRWHYRKQGAIWKGRYYGQ